MAENFLQLNQDKTVLVVGSEAHTEKLFIKLKPFSL